MQRMLDKFGFEQKVFFRRPAQHEIDLFLSLFKESSQAEV